MPFFEEIKSYTVYVAQSDLASYDRSISLSLKSGETAFIAFPQVRPMNWLQIDGPSTTLYMSVDHYAEVYHLLQTERPVFFTAANVIGFRVGGVHTRFDFSKPRDIARSGEPTGEGYQDQSIEALMVRAKEQLDTQDPTATS